MNKHTPGPWAVTSVSMNTGNVSVGHRDLRIVIAEVTNAASFGDMLDGAMKRGGGGFEQDDCHTQFANARLIAAAPDLLQALLEILGPLNVCSDNKNVSDDVCLPIDLTMGELRRARAAIAKAEGR